MLLFLSLTSWANPTQEINTTFRTASLPDGWFDGFFSNGDEARPIIKTQSFGLERSRSKNNTNWTLYYEFFQNQTTAGYWDDLEEPLDRTDGVWVKPIDVQLHTLGFQSMFEIDIPIPEERIETDLLIGGGLGIGVLTGSIERWHNGGTDYAANNSGCIPIGDAIVREALCGNDPDATELPIPVLPVLDLSIAFRVRYDRFNTRIMFGLHNLPYFGFGLGYRL